MEKIIQLKNVTKIYEGKIKTLALNNINLEIEKGIVCAIYGQSGSGKTTLLNIIGGLDKPTIGEVIIKNNNITNLQPDELAIFRNEKIGFVFQFHYLISELNILENIIAPVFIRRKTYNYKEAVNKAKELASVLEIENILDKYPDYVSGGQRQRAAICRALINEPELVLADEPTGKLDSKNAELVVELFFRLNNLKKTSFVIVTHDLNIAKRCKKMIEIKDGQIIKIIEN